MLLLSASRYSQNHGQTFTSSNYFWCWFCVMFWISALLQGTFHISPLEVFDEMYIFLFLQKTLSIQTLTFNCMSHHIFWCYDYRIQCEINHSPLGFQQHILPITIMQVFYYMEIDQATITNYSMLLQKKSLYYRKISQQTHMLQIK